MKNYIIGILAVIILVLTSIIYKQNQTTVPKPFPPLDEAFKGKSEAPLILYFFFSKNNCRSCLEIIEALNELPPHFIVLGIVPENELKDEKEIRTITGAIFPIISPVKLKRHLPSYTPSLIGVSPKRGKIFFTLPSVPDGKACLLIFLETLYGRIYDALLEENRQDR